MKSHLKAATGFGALTRELWDVPIRVRLLPYVEFGRRMDGELERLVDRWIGRAAPSAQRRHKFPFVPTASD
jgi:hypothetical protein